MPSIVFFFMGSLSFPTGTLNKLLIKIQKKRKVNYSYMVIIYLFSYSVVYYRDLTHIIIYKGRTVSYIVKYPNIMFHSINPKPFILLVSKIDNRYPRNETRPNCDLTYL